MLERCLILFNPREGIITNNFIDLFLIIKDFNRMTIDTDDALAWQTNDRIPAPFLTAMH